jgi:hypothetical protein
LTAALTITSSTQIIKSKVLAASGGPELLITEVLPWSNTVNDEYEYLELYNNSDSSIDLKDYKLPLQNVDISESKIIAPKGVLVICTKSDTTLEDFNSFYGADLNEDMFMNLPLLYETLSNTTGQAIVLAKDDTTVVTKVEYLVSDFELKKSVNYRYPQTGYIMDKLSVKQDPTPGMVTEDQIFQNGTRVTGVNLDKTYAVLDINQTLRIFATVSPATATNKTVIWASENPDIVAVDQNGVLSAKAYGDAVITVTTVDGSYSATCQVTVTDEEVEEPQAAKLRLNKTFIRIKEGKFERLNPIFNPGNVKDKSVTWTSSDESIATVTDGKVNGIKKGVVTITVKFGDQTAECLVYVTDGKSGGNGKGKGASKWD